VFWIVDYIVGFTFGSVVSDELLRYVVVIVIVLFVGNLLL